MVARKKLVAGNWKLNGTRPFISSLISELKSDHDGIVGVEMVVCPPYVYLPFVGELLSGSRLQLGAQNVCEHSKGAYTGEVAAEMLAEVGCAYVIIGHSERRHLYGESNALVTEKFAATQAAGLVPILCVGELLEQRERDETESVIAAQLDSVVEKLGVTALGNSIIAYEPVWAIGTGKTASPKQAQAVHRFIRQRIADKDVAIADDLRILYGGSVNGDNAAELFAQDDIDGGLIGGASLKSDAFLRICQAAT